MESVERFMLAGISIVLVICICVNSGNSINNFIEKNEAIATITAGEIVDKKLKTEYGLFLGGTHPVYYIYINGTAKYGGSVHETERSFCVSEDIYNQYSIGDWFDSKDLIADKEEEQE